MSGVLGVRLGARTRGLLTTVVAGVAASGLAWMALGAGLDEAGFDDPRHAWRHLSLVWHGSLAYGLIWLVGGLLPRHQIGAWRARRNRVAGAALSMLLLMLAASGLALYYPPFETVDFSLPHQLAGVLLVVLLPAHILLGRRTRPTWINRVGVR